VNGIPPDGQDAGSIAAEAISNLFAGSGWEPKGDPYDPQELWFELVRLAKNIIRSLQRRKENSIVANEGDLPHAESSLSDEFFFNNYPGNNISADQEAERNEAKERFDQFRGEFKDALGSEEDVKELFDCICEGGLKRDELADFLKITPQEVTNIRKRLDRRLEKFAAEHPNYPRSFIEEVKDV
jgi:hypothetical protein